MPKCLHIVHDLNLFGIVDIRKYLEKQHSKRFSALPVQSLVCHSWVLITYISEFFEWRKLSSISRMSVCKMISFIRWYLYLKFYLRNTLKFTDLLILDKDKWKYMYVKVGNQGRNPSVSHFRCSWFLLLTDLYIKSVFSVLLCGVGGGLSWLWLFLVGMRVCTSLTKM